MHQPEPCGWRVLRTPARQRRFRSTTIALRPRGRVATRARHRSALPALQATAVRPPDLRREQRVPPSGARGGDPPVPDRADPRGGRHRREARQVRDVRVVGAGRSAAPARSTRRPWTPSTTSWSRPSRHPATAAVQVLKHRDPPIPGPVARPALLDRPTMGRAPGSPRRTEAGLTRAALDDGVRCARPPAFDQTPDGSWRRVPRCGRPEPWTPASPTGLLRPGLRLRSPRSRQRTPAPRRTVRRPPRARRRRRRRSPTTAGAGPRRSERPGFVQVGVELLHGGQRGLEVGRVHRLHGRLFGRVVRHGKKNCVTRCSFGRLVRATLSAGPRSLGLVVLGFPPTPSALRIALQEVVCAPRSTAGTAGMRRR